MDVAGAAAALDFDEALRLVRTLVPPTPLLEVPELSEQTGTPVHLKLESLQVTGSFKVRGATARILALEEDELARGVVTCSSGNHGLAVSWVAGRLDVPAVVCVPDWVDPVKLEAIRECGAEALLSGPGYDAAAARAWELAETRGLVFVHPFDDPRVAAGQGTVALEILEQLPDVGRVVIPLSGGGLAGGMGAAFSRFASGVEVVAASAERARVMYESLRTGAPLAMPEEDTLASALAGGIELENRWTFRLVRDHVDGHVLVAEGAIARAMAWAYRRLNLVVEGGGAVGIAAVREGLPGFGSPATAPRMNAANADADETGPRPASPPPSGSPTVVVVSGGNVSDGVLRRALSEA